MRTTGSVARRLVAGAFLAFVMTLTLAGVASAASDTDTNSNTNTNTNTQTQSSTIAGENLHPRTGADMWIPLMVGGFVITVAVATRVGLARAARRI